MKRALGIALNVTAGVVAWCAVAVFERLVTRVQSYADSTPARDDWRDLP